MKTDKRIIAYEHLRKAYNILIKIEPDNEKLPELSNLIFQQTMQIFVEHPEYLKVG